MAQDAKPTTTVPGRPEEEVYEYKTVKWKDFVTKKKYIPWWILSIVLGVLLVLFTLKKDQIVEALRPISEKIRDIPGGFVIPVAILILISFPPLFGHELIALLCGIVYGLWTGFAIVAAGTFIGEVGTWFAFKYAFRRKAQKLERTNLNYGSMARLTREGGFWIVLVIRFSIVPSHLSTAVFSTCNVRFWHFAVATFLTLPKQIILVYFGVLLVSKSEDKLISTAVVGVTFLITVVAGFYIYKKMGKWKKVLIAEQEARLSAKDDIEAFSPVIGATESGTWGPPQPRQEHVQGRGGAKRQDAEQSYELQDTTGRPARTQEWV